MKRFAAVLAMTLVLVLSMGQAVFGLSITSTTPADGETGKQTTNVAVKFTFSDKISDDSAQLNEKKFVIKDEEGTEIPYSVVCDKEKYPNDLWVMCEKDLQSNATYTVTALSGINIGGSTLGSDHTFSFKTRNTKTDSLISFGMMAIFMVAMFGATKKAQKDASGSANAKQAVKEETNPYKLAKEKGISVEEARKTLEGKKAEKAEKNSKKAAKAAEKQAALDARVAELEKKLEEEAEAARRALNYKVHRPASITAKGYKVPKAARRTKKK